MYQGIKMKMRRDKSHQKESEYSECLIPLFKRCQCFALVFTLSDRASILEKLASSLPSSLPSFLARDRQNPPRPHSKFVRIKTPSSNISSDIQNGKSTRKLSNSINSLKPRKQQQISLERILRLTGWTNWDLPRKLKYMLFERCLAKNRKRSTKQHINYYHFRSRIQLDHCIN